MNFLKNTLALLFFFSISTIITAQDNYWQGKWEVKISENSFCNIHITTNFIENQAPKAIVTGMKDGEPFTTECEIKEIPNRNSIVLVEKSKLDKSGNYDNEDMMLIMVKMKGAISLIWGKVNLVSSKSNRTVSLDKTRNPHYQGEFAVKYQNKRTFLTISDYQKNEFSANLNNSSIDLNCTCTLESTHLATCASKTTSEVFLLDFNSRGVDILPLDTDTAQRLKRAEGGQYNLVSRHRF